MTKREEWFSIAERCEKATGPDRGIDVAVWVALGGSVERRVRDRKEWLYLGKCSYLRQNPMRLDVRYRVTTSLDAITALTERELPGWMARVGVMLAINEIRWAIGDNGRAMLADLPNVVRSALIEAAANARNAALEEAAKECDRRASNTADFDRYDRRASGALAAAIRGMKEG